jgi:cytoskeletal protein RodZ
MESIGQHLKQSRERRAKSIEELARETRIPAHAIALLENDRFDELPGEVFVRGFLRAYARAVSIPIDETMARYTLSRRAASVEALPIESRRLRLPKRSRVGVAIGFVVLLILFTIAISVLLKPRGQREPSELAASHRPAMGALLG